MKGLWHRSLTVDQGEGGFCETVGKTFHMRVILHETTPISLIKECGYHFPTGQFLL